MSATRTSASREGGEPCESASSASAASGAGDGPGARTTRDASLAWLITTPRASWLTASFVPGRAIVGHVRFNGVGGFNANYPARMIGRVFECAEPCLWRGQNKILFKTLLPPRTLADRYLVVMRAAEIGRLRVGEPAWCSEDVWVIALSESLNDQEAMLLMAAAGSLRTSVGAYRLKADGATPWRAALELEVGREA